MQLCLFSQYTYHAFRLSPTQGAVFVRFGTRAVSPKHYFQQSLALYSNLYTGVDNPFTHDQICQYQKQNTFFTKCEIKISTIMIVIHGKILEFKGKKYWDTNMSNNHNGWEKINPKQLIQYMTKNIHISNTWQKTYISATHSCSDRRADRTCCSLSKRCAAITSLVQASSNEVDRNSINEENDCCIADWRIGQTYRGCPKFSRKYWLFVWLCWTSSNRLQVVTFPADLAQFWGCS